MDPEEDNVQSLKGKACLDNCVTVLDAAELFNNLASISSLKASTPAQNGAATQQSNPKSPMQEREKGVAEEDERNVAELLLDQIEFANVILLNKQDLVPDKVSRQTLLAAVRNLNPKAGVRFTTKCKASTRFLLICCYHSYSTVNDDAAAQRPFVVDKLRNLLNKTTY